jgi:hypothetical protein
MFNEMLTPSRLPRMILQVGGSISLLPGRARSARSVADDTRHMLAELNPAPDQ